MKNSASEFDARAEIYASRMKRGTTSRPKASVSRSNAMTSAARHAMPNRISERRGMTSAR